MQLRVELDATGVIRRLAASGHAGFGARGSDIVCSAASVLVLTVARTLEESDGVDVDGGTETAGKLVLEVKEIREECLQWSLGVTEMFLKGIGDLAGTFPEHIELAITRD